MIRVDHHRRRGGVAAIASVALAAASLVAVSAPAHGADEAAGSTLGDLDGVTRVDDHTVTFSAGDARLRITANTDDTLHVELAPTGSFTNPDDAPADPTKPDEKMIPNPAAAAGGLALEESGAAYTLKTDAAVLTITKASPTITLARPDGTVLMRETKPLSWTDTATTQTLERQEGEQFFGAGEQNGGFNHTGKTINVANSFNWNEGGYNNSQPYYVSTKGYGVFRHTFAPGAYTFGSLTDAAAPVTTTENEKRYDAYLFVGDVKQVVDSYTDLVGKPFMPPLYGLEMGDSDCYLHNANRGERKTLRDATAIAEGYTTNGMPNGWMLVNDGYGCGYEQLAETAQMLQDHNMELGLWTQNGLAKQKEEVAQGSRVAKLDVAWVGPGYRFALDGCQSAYDGINKHDSVDARGFVYQPNSWAGAQRCAVLWSGDQYGTWDYIRWQIPTYAADTVSGIAYGTGDVDGIFGGSAKTYARDLQWKMFLPTTMTMDGWAPMDKQPWRYGEQVNAINRKYLLLKERLLPYQYTYSAEATKTGLGMVRPLWLENPTDAKAYTDAAKYEFLSGDDFLVAPVYEDSSVRNGIYLPAGTWVDYWTGRTYTGPTTINGYHAPLDTLPLFVKAGAIVPMFPENTMSWKTRDKSRLDVDIYPQGANHFDLYEDDGHTKQFAKGESSTQRISVSAPERGRGDVTVTLGAIAGTYDGQVDKRTYGLTVHTPAQPAQVLAGNRPLDRVTGADALAAATSGWYYDGATGIAHVKTAPLGKGSSLAVKLVGASAVAGVQDDSAVGVAFSAPTITKPGSTTTIPVTVRNDTTATLEQIKVALSSDTTGVTGTSADGPAELEPGQSATVDVQVSAAADVPSGKAVLTAKATYVARARSYTSELSAETVVPYPSVASAFNNNGVTDASTYLDGNFDGSKNSFWGEGLAAAGLTRGAAVPTTRGVDFTWPDVDYAANDNIVAAGQTIAINGRGNVLGLLGSGAGTNASGNVTVIYADGTTSTATTGMPNWCCLSETAFGATRVKQVLGRYTQAGRANTTVNYKVFANTIRLDPAKEVVAVTLPSNSQLHVFDIAVGAVALPPAPPAGTTQVSDLTWISATNGWGPVEKDMSNGENGAGDGGPLRLDGVTYSKGLGVHSPSTVSYFLGGRCTRFTATVGIDDEIPDYGSVIFSVLVDGKVKQVSTTMTGTWPSYTFDVDTTGATYLDLNVRSGTSGESGNHGDWADAKVTCTA